MKKFTLPRVPAAFLSIALFSLPSAAQACTVCMGDVNSKSAGAINAAMFLMIGVIGTMLASFGVFAFYLSRRAAGPVPPHAEFGQSMSDGQDFS